MTIKELIKQLEWFKQNVDYVDDDTKVFIEPKKYSERNGILEIRTEYDGDIDELVITGRSSWRD